MFCSSCSHALEEHRWYNSDGLLTVSFRDAVVSVCGVCESECPPAERDE